MAAFLKAVSLISGSIGIIRFAETDLPDWTKGNMDSLVRVAVGLNSNKDGPTNADGTSPVILAYNDVGSHIGHSFFAQRSHIKTGSYKDIIVHQVAGPGEQATTLQVCAVDNDAICVAYISQTWSDGLHRGWLGDMARECGSEWYYSNIVVGQEGYRPACAWIDRDHSNGIRSSALQIHMEDFMVHENNSKIVEDPAFYCRQPAMLFKHKHRYHHFGFAHLDYALWTGPDEDQEYLTNPRIPKRVARQRRQENPFEHLITSTHQDHSASELCTSDSSHGPDFVSLAEGVFCDMSTGTVWRLCKEGDEERGICFHLEQQKVVHADNGIHAERSWSDKKYSHVEEWT